MKYLFVILLLTTIGPLRGDQLSDDALKKIGFDQELGAEISLGLPFVDENGRPVHLSDYFGQHPVILDLGYYGCPMLCGAVLNGMTGALQDVPLKMGRDYEVLNVSIDPTETPSLALAKKDTYVKRFGQPDAARGWHFLTGDEKSIRKLCDEVGFHYAYDPNSHQYAHASGLVFLSPQGKVIQYLPGVAFASRDVQQALANAATAKVGTRLQQLFLLCFHYNPLTGKYSGLIIDAVRLFGLAVLAALIVLIVGSIRRPRLPAGKRVEHG